MNKRVSAIGIAVFVLAFSRSSADPHLGARSPSGHQALATGADQPVPGQAAADLVKRVNEISAFISGLPSSDPSLKALEATAAWLACRDLMNDHWAKLEASRFRPIRSWADTVLSRANDKTRLLFYPFGGPDLQTALEIFPKMETYILVGLEPVGNLPEIETWKPEHMKSYLEDIEVSLSDFVSKSYFITRDMNVNLQSSKLDGVLPLLCIFLKRGQRDIVDIQRIEFDDSGRMLESPYRPIFKTPVRPYGIKIDFLAAGSRRRERVFYFSCDLSDEHFDMNSKFYRYLDSAKKMSVLVKSASYLLHYDNFSNIRNLLLSKSRFILEDDTGIPYRYFRKDGWKVRLFGEYSEPARDFKGVEQADLKAAYRVAGEIGPLPFHVGYHWETKRDCLLLIEKE